MDKLFQEVGYVAYHFHWSREEIMDLPHPERHRWVKVISEINRKINAADGGGDAGANGAMSRRSYEPPPPPPGISRVSKGVALRSNPEELRRVLAERAAREALERG